MISLSLYRNGLKRAFDVTLAACGLGVFALPMAWIAWRLRSEAGPPVLFRQPRVGRGGKLFTIYKFRTMNKTGEVAQGLSRRLRATAMDELPQLFNILRGEMSFVGPRPLIPEELENLASVPKGRDRLQVRPGLTGLAQTHSAKTPSLQERIQWDLAYVERCSFWLDMKLLFRSLAVTLSGKWEGAEPGAHGR